MKNKQAFPKPKAATYASERRKTKLNQIRWEGGEGAFFRDDDIIVIPLFRTRNDKLHFGRAGCRTRDSRRGAGCANVYYA